MTKEERVIGEAKGKKVVVRGQALKFLDKMTKEDREKLEKLIVAQLEKSERLKK